MLENLKNTILARLNTFQDSAIYIALEEKYDRLQPSQQLMIKLGSTLLIFASVFLIIQSLFSNASTKIEDFNNSRALISKLSNLKTSMNSSPLVPTTPGRSELIQRINSAVQSSNVASQQIINISNANIKKDIKTSSLDTSGIEVKLKTLNLTQIADVASKIQDISSSIKIVSVDISNSTEEPRYFDVNYKIAAFYPKVAKIEPDDDKEDKKSKRRKKRRVKNRDKDKDEEEGKEEDKE